MQFNTFGLEVTLYLIFHEITIYLSQENVLERSNFGQSQWEPDKIRCSWVSILRNGRFGRYLWCSLDYQWWSFHSTPQRNPPAARWFSSLHTNTAVGEREMTTESLMDKHCHNIQFIIRFIEFRLWHWILIAICRRKNTDRKRQKDSVRQCSRWLY